MGSGQQSRVLWPGKRDRRHLEHRVFSEKLYGASTGSPMPYAADSSNGKRGIFAAAMPTNYNSQNQSYALQGMKTCQSIPGTQQASGVSWCMGFSWTWGYQWNWFTSTCNHYNTPNKFSCLTSADINASTFGGPKEQPPPRAITLGESTCASPMARSGSSKTRSIPRRGGPSAPATAGKPSVPISTELRPAAGLDRGPHWRRECRRRPVRARLLGRVCSRA